MSQIKITTENGKTTLAAPYNPDMPKKARAIGGKFDRSTSTWIFDARDEQRVRDLAIDIYGTDGAPTQTVTARINLDDFHGYLTSQRGGEKLWLFGRPIVARRERDSSVHIGDGVIIIDGGFPESGGSVKNPCIDAYKGTILEIRDVPASHPELTEYADAIEIVDTSAVDTDALMAEREKLLARIAEIDAQLPEPEAAEMSTRETAVALSVSVRTVQRWAATGKVNASKNDAGRWVITITV